MSPTADHSLPERIGLIGDPVEHSLSPAFQQPAFDALNLNVRYELWPTPLSGLPTRLQDIRAGRAVGANVTVPHKEAVFPLMDRVSLTARRAGAVNTIVRDGTALFGDNTDVYGFAAPLTEQDFEFPSSEAVILGAGGAARGVAVALLDAGIARLTILNRTVTRAQSIVGALDDYRLQAGSINDAVRVCAGSRLLINATSLGWHDDLPVDRDVFAIVARDAIAYDLTYRETPFLAAARAAGLATLDGLPMLVHQGARSFELWTGQQAPHDLMWQAAVAARAARDR
jgi:shikimate dehydrogenase